MNDAMTIGHDHIGLLVWLVWALIGVFAALFAQRFTGGRRTFMFDLVIAVVAAVLGGLLSVNFVGDTPVQLFLLSVLASAFFAAAALWVTASLIDHFRKEQ